MEKNVVTSTKIISELIKSYRDNHALDKVLIAEKYHNNVINQLITLCKTYNVKYQFVAQNMLSSYCRDHHGVVGILSKVNYIDIFTLIETEKRKLYSILVVLDRIQDPQNFGAIIRTAYGLNVSSIIYQERRQVPITDTVINVSRGAIGGIKFVKVKNIVNVIDLLKNNGYWIFTADRNGDVCYKINIPNKIVLIVGNEDTGTREIVKKKSDFIISIPQNKNINSLNVSVATGILLYEINRQLKNENNRT